MAAYYAVWSFVPLHALPTFSKGIFKQRSLFPLRCTQLLSSNLLLQNSGVTKSCSNRSTKMIEKPITQLCIAEKHELRWCWASVVDDGPTSAQHWANASCLLGGCLWPMITPRFRLSYVINTVLRQLYGHKYSNGPISCDFGPLLYLRFIPICFAILVFNILRNLCFQYLIQAMQAQHLFESRRRSALKYEITYPKRIKIEH